MYFNCIVKMDFFFVVRKVNHETRDQVLMYFFFHVSLVKKEGKEITIRFDQVSGIGLLIC